MTDIAAPTAGNRLGRIISSDFVAATAALFFLLMAIVALVGPVLFGDLAVKVTLQMRNVPPFDLSNGFAYILGGDSLGRSLLARIIVGARNSMGIAFFVVCISMVAGGMIGLFAGYFGGWVDQAVMRITDVVMSFPALLLTLVVLYLLGPSVANVVIVLAVTRLPIYIRTMRAEVLELRSRPFVSASRLMGASSGHVVFSHIIPITVPTLTTIAAVEFATVMLTESALSFLGFGIQPPEFTWGAMVAAGRGYLASAWWLSFWPGLMIIATSLSLNLMSNWLRVLLDPHQRWRLRLETSGVQ